MYNGAPARSRSSKLPAGGGGIGWGLAAVELILVAAVKRAFPPQRRIVFEMPAETTSTRESWSRSANVWLRPPGSTTNQLGEYADLQAVRLGPSAIGEPSACDFVSFGQCRCTRSDVRESRAPSAARTRSIPEHVVGLNLQGLSNGVFDFRDLQLAEVSSWVLGCFPAACLFREADQRADVIVDRCDARRCQPLAKFRNPSETRLAGACWRSRG